MAAHLPFYCSSRATERTYHLGRNCSTPDTEHISCSTAAHVLRNTLAWRSNVSHVTEHICRSTAAHVLRNTRVTEHMQLTCHRANRGARVTTHLSIYCNSRVTFPVFTFLIWTYIGLKWKNFKVII